MSLITMNIMLKSLMRTVPVNIILPIDKFTGAGEQLPIHMPFKTLYLLNGVYGNQNDWITGTGILRWAQEKDLAVVMPAGENMFYIDMPGMGNNYSTFIRELVEVTRMVFPLSAKKADTFIGGLSMGGYGALMNGLKYNDLFSRIIALSAVNNIAHPMESCFYQSYEFTSLITGGIETAKNSELNINWKIKELAESGSADTKIFMACGKSDMLLFESREMKKCFEENGFDLEYTEYEGSHDWDFWNIGIREALKWLPLGTVDENGEQKAFAS